jgi:preprotein translocase subunit SecA
MKDDEALESRMLSKSIEKAQRKVEENNFGIRKRLLEYDDVMNYQREAIYSRRRNALSGERVEIDVMNMMVDTASIITDKTQGWSYQDFSEYLMSQLSIDPGFDEEWYSNAKPDDIAKKLYEHMEETYKRRMQAMIDKVWPVLKEVYEKQGSIYQRIAIPISDGRKELRLAYDLKKAYETEGKELSKGLSKAIVLWQIDDHWKQHLRDMDDLRQSVQNAAYEQKDPLVVYKLESYNLFAAMLENLNKDVLSFLFRAFIPLRDPAAAQPPRPERRPRDIMSQMKAQREQLSTNGQNGPKQNTPAQNIYKNVGRNDPCPCGSGKKFKNCHGRFMN